MVAMVVVEAAVVKEMLGASEEGLNVLPMEMSWVLAWPVAATLLVCVSVLW
jgi:hypothetical protein